jgi:hypothetical protein
MKEQKIPKRNIYKWLYETERRQRIRVQRRMWKLYKENRRLGGKVWKEIEAAYDYSPNDGR